MIILIKISKRISLVTLLFTGILIHSSYAQHARIKLDIDRTVGQVNKHIFGNFAEHLGRCIYGGIYDPDSKLSNPDGMRTDVMQAARDLNVTILRYPGGNFVSNYHWKDGVGPKDQRPPRMELAWHRLETNQFGTDEYIEFCRKIGTDPYISVNMGTGTMEEAQQWVEYCNVKSGPYYAELRKKYGHPEPYNVKYWSLGNEMDGYWQMGHLNVEDYSKKARETAKLMRLTDPCIKLIAAGSSNYRPGADPDYWNRTVLDNLKDYVDYISLHMYVGNPDNNYYNFIATPLVLEQRTNIVRGMIDEVMQDANRGDRAPIHIAWDEYNVWYRARSGKLMEGNRALEEHYNLEDALVISEFLNAFIRNADVVKMANMAQLVNVIAPIFTSEKGMYKQTIFYPLALYANNVKGTSLDAYVDCDTYDTKRFNIGLGEATTQQSNVPYLDVSASYQDNGEVVLSVVNRNKDEAITTDIISQKGTFDGNFEVYEVNGPDIKAKNNFDQTRVQTEKKDDIKGSGTTITYSFPPHSLTMIKGKIITD